MTKFSNKVLLVLLAFILMTSTTSWAAGAETSKDATPAEPTKDATPTEETVSAEASKDATSEPIPKLPHRDPRGSTGAAGPAADSDVSKERLVNMPPVDVPIIKDNKHLGYLGITITWQAKDVENAEKIKKLLPRLRSMVITDLYSALYILWSPGVLPEREYVVKRLKASAQTVMGPGVVEEVYARDYYVKDKPGR